MKVSVLTLGCRVNQSESSEIEGTLKENGVTIVDLKENPDYCVINTCSVTAKGDYDSRQLIRRAVRAGARVIVTGCYSQLRPEDIRLIPGVARVVDNRRKQDIVSHIIGRKTESVFTNYSRSRPHLKMQDGCNFRCSYCSVPLARGRSRSIPPEEVIRRARLIESAGYREIVLTGIHLGTYGHDLSDKVSISSILRRLLRETSIPRFRLSSLEIGEVDGEMIELLNDPRVCRHLHLPLQSGSETVLRMMKRRYSARTFANRVLEIARSVGEIAIGSDVIVGFPGEGDYEFGETLRIVADLPFSYMHIFPFSPRPGTAASNMEGRATSAEVKGRMSEIKGLALGKRGEYLQGQLGKVLDVVLEDAHPDGVMLGTSSNYLKISVASAGLDRKSLVHVRAERVQKQALWGSVITGE